MRWYPSGTTGSKSRRFHPPFVATPTRSSSALADWLKNVRAAGRFTLEQKGVANEVGELELIDKAAAGTAFPRWLRGGLRHTGHFLRVMRLSETGSEQASQSGALLR